MQNRRNGNREVRNVRNVLRKNFFRRGVGIHHSNRYDSFPLADDMIYVSQPPVISTGFPTDEAIKQICSTKSNFWEYEQEVRFVKAVSSNRQSPFLPVRIHAVYLGVRVSDERERLIRRLIEQFNRISKEPIEVYKLRRENVSFYTDW